MHRVRPTGFLWFFGIWAVALAWGLASPKLNAGDVEPVLMVAFWILAFASISEGIRVIFQIYEWRKNPVVFDPGNGCETVKLYTRDRLAKQVLVALLWATVFAFTLGSLPFSKRAQLVAGLRQRTITFPETHLAAEDNQLADVLLLPVGRFPLGAAAALAADLRKESGMLVATLQPYDLPHIEFDEKRGQVVFESLQAPLLDRAKLISLPRGRRPHSPLLIALLADDMFSRNNDWRFMLSGGLTKTIAVVATGRLKLDLSWDDERAQAQLFSRTRKLILRLVALQIFDKPRDTERKSLIGLTLRGLEDLDGCEDHLRFSIKKLVGKGSSGVK